LVPGVGDCCNKFPKCRRGFETGWWVEAGRKACLTTNRRAAETASVFLEDT
jgi:hypothetical protein